MSSGTYKPRTTMDLGKALAIMGLSTWSTLEPVTEEGNEDYVKTKLNQILFLKTCEIETKRGMMVKKEKKILSMEEGPSKRRFLYQLHQEKLASTALNEERVLHEAYQYLVREFECRQELRLNEIEERRGSDGDLEPEEDIRDHHKLLTPQPSRKKKQKKRQKSELYSLYRGERDSYENGDFETPQDPMKNEAISAGLENLYLLSPQSQMHTKSLRRGSMKVPSSL